ncbi:tyrosine-protein kinase csk-1-like isoform X1 [Montipora capricornis]|uniref:tyrosine-protein kinase csk-1-like isoform X1 n=1 Tax=Montipora capricornis TaxID=246305 RepID=UPI0035F1EEA5
MWRPVGSEEEIEASQTPIKSLRTTQKIIIHRDLAARNVLLDKNCECKVTDFGLSYQNFKYGHGNAKKGCMPVKWTAPEILFGDASNLSTKSDVMAAMTSRGNHLLDWVAFLY